MSNTASALAFNPVPATAAHAINHLLSQAGWARQSLRAHAGKTATFDLGVFALRLRVTPEGLVTPAESTDAAESGAAASAADNVVIALRLADLPLIAANPDRAISYVAISGDAEFANVISSLSRGLRWDAGLDLGKVVGDIAAHRLVTAAEALKASVQATRKSVTENIAEYLLEEKAVLVRPAAVAAQGAAIAVLRDDVERLTKRLERLAQRARTIPAEGKRT